MSEKSSAAGLLLSSICGIHCLITVLIPLIPALGGVFGEFGWFESFEHLEEWFWLVVIIFAGHQVYVRKDWRFPYFIAVIVVGSVGIALHNELLIMIGFLSNAVGMFYNVFSELGRHKRGECSHEQLH